MNSNVNASVGPVDPGLRLTLAAQGALDALTDYPGGWANDVQKCQWEGVRSRAADALRAALAAATAAQPTPARKECPDCHVPGGCVVGQCAIGCFTVDKLVDDLDELASDMNYEGNCKGDQEACSRAALIDRGVRLLKSLAAATAAQPQPLPMDVPQDQARAALALLKHIRFHPRRHDLDRDWLTRADEVLGTFGPVDTSKALGGPQGASHG